MHQSWLKNHMCVLGWIYRSHARNGNEIQTSGRRGSAGKIEKLGFLIPVIPKHAWKSWNLAWCHNMARTCCGNFFGRIGTIFGVGFLQTELPSKRFLVPRGNAYHLRVRNDTRTLPSPALIFLHRQIRPNRSIKLSFGIIPGSFSVFYTLIEFLSI